MKKAVFLKASMLVLGLLLPVLSFSQNAIGTVPSLGGIRIEFILFALTLLGVAVLHHKTMYVALTGLAAILIFKFSFPGTGATAFNFVEHIIGNQHSEGEWRTLVNLFGLLFGFAILAKHFEESGVPDVLPKFLPNDWKGGFLLLFLIMVISSFLDNIAAAMIGGTVAFVVFKGKVQCK